MLGSKVVAASVLAVLCVWALVMARFKPRSSGHVAWMKAQRLRSARTKDAGLDDVLFSTRAKLGLGRFTAMDLLSDFDARFGAERLDEGRTPTAWTSELTRAHNAAAAPMERVLLTGVACGLFQVDDPKALPLRFSLTDEGKKALAEIRDARPIADQGNVISID